MNTNPESTTTPVLPLCALVEAEGGRGHYLVAGIVDPTNTQGPVIESQVSYQRRKGVLQMPGGFEDVRLHGRERPAYNIPEGFYGMDVILVSGEGIVEALAALSTTVCDVTGKGAVLKALQKAGYRAVEVAGTPARQE